MADLAPYGLLPSPSKYEVIDMSVPFYMEPYRIVVPWPQPESPLLAPIRPFQPLVHWILLYYIQSNVHTRINCCILHLGLALSWSDFSGDADRPRLSDWSL